MTPYLESKGFSAVERSGGRCDICAWAEIAGEEVARHCRPAALSDGILVIHVDHPAWATQLTFQVCRRSSSGARNC